MVIQKAAEDYLEAMLMMKEKHGFIRSMDVAEQLHVTKPSVTYTTKRLRENGYSCTEERLVQDKGKLYVILSVTGGPSGEASDAERYGGFCLEHDPLYGLYLEQQLRRLYLRMDGLHRGGDESEAEPLAALADILEEKKEAWQRGNGQ